MGTVANASHGSAGKRRGKAAEWDRRYKPFIILGLAPTLLLFALFVLGPTISAVAISLSDYSLIKPSWRFTGIGNYAALIKDEVFLKALGNTVLFVLLTVPLNIVLSLPIAMGLNRIKALRSFFRACYYIPTVTSLAAVSLVWMYMYDPGAGLINAILKAVGLPAQSWLRDPRLALLSVVIVYVWQDLGYNVVVFLAALQGLPRMYYEAAEIDGAGPWQLFTRITLPLMRRTMGMVVILTMISAFKVFAPIHIMTQGGPLNCTKVLVYYIYENAFSYLKMGYASAIALVLFLIVLALTLVQLALFRTDWSY